MPEDGSSSVEGSASEKTAAPGEYDPTGVGPIFVSGRQHSGNTVTTCVFGMVPACFAGLMEGWFFEHRAIVDKLKDLDVRARRVAELLRLDDEELTDRTSEALSRWHVEQPDATATDLYREGMRFAAASHDKQFWVQQATSYIFYAQDILRLMPDARFIYLLRNPYDLCASEKRRDPKRERLWGCVVSWNKGLALAGKLQEEYPDRFIITRYEDIVTDPEKTYRKVFDFVGVPFHEKYLDVPHVNRSEAPHTWTSSSRGLTSSRLYYYTSVLSPAERAAVDMLGRKDKIAEYYPDLPHHQARYALSTRAKAVFLVIASPFRYALLQFGTLLSRDSAWQLRRILRRIRMITR